MNDRAPRIDFFISYSPADERWATWIAWELESAGYRTLIQAWDFVPGTNFIDLMDRGVREARVVVAVLSGRYLASDNCRVEWQAALRGGRDKLVTVRVEDCELEGLLATITYVDLVGVATADEARARLLARLNHAVERRAKPSAPPSDPTQSPPPPPSSAISPSRTPPRRSPATPPSYPPQAGQRAAPREVVSILHVPGPRFGREGGRAPDELQARAFADVARMHDAGAPAPDLVLVSGNLTESARLREIEAAHLFLSGLRVLLRLEPNRLAIVPGPHDVSRAACRAYFAQCEARDIEPRRPFYPKLEHFEELFSSLYEGLDADGLAFDSAQPWSLFEVPDLRVVVAGLNSTMAIDDRPERDHGLLGEEQAAWFAARLRQHEEAGWLRLGLMWGAPGLLSDSETFEPLVGRRLSLLVSGPGQPEILELTAGGLRRWGTGTERFALEARAWPGTGATFAPPDDRPPPATTVVDQVLSPTDLLLEQVAEVLEARYDHVKVRRINGLGQLLVTRRDEGRALHWRVGALSGTPTRADLEAFVASDPGPGSELVYQGPSPAPGLRGEAQLLGVRLCSFAELQGLLDLSDYVTRQTVRLRSDLVYPPDLYVPQRYRDLDREGPGAQEDVAGELMRMVADGQGRFALVLGDFGRGKTYLLRELAQRIAEQLPHVTPILIELRALDKAHTVEGLVAAHLANHGEEVIDLHAFRYMLRHGRVALLFDGFDELVTRVTYDRATEHLDTLLQAMEGEAKVILTSRSQHFRSHAQVLNALGTKVGLLPHRRIFVLEDFTPDQVHTYLVNRYGSSEAADRRLAMMKGIHDLPGLAQNPRMLSFVANLEEGRLAAVARSGARLSAAGLYREVLTSWLAHEGERARGGRGALRGLGVDDLWSAVRLLALRLWETGEPYLKLSELADIADTLTGLAESQLSPEQATHAMGAGSLLERTDEGLFGFMHGSLADWLVADTIAKKLAEDPPELGYGLLPQPAIDFLCDLADIPTCQAWVERTLASPRASELRRRNALRIGARLRTPPSANLRGASLRGEDLSFRDWHAADFTGADLTGAQLVGANLRGAVLRDARLAGAQLDEACLADADLSGADLTQARLASVDLTGAVVAGSRWRRAALINAIGQPDAPELGDAAVVPGQGLVTVFAPAEIGVRHGFRRLPDPVAYSWDGGTLAIGSEDGGILICDTGSGRPVRNLQGHRGRVYAVRYGPADRLLVSGASDGDMRVWDAVSGECLHVHPGHVEGVWPLLISPHPGGPVASGDATGTLRIWSTRTGGLLHAIEQRHGIIYSASFHARGRLLATGHQDGAVHVWDTESGDIVMKQHAGAGAAYRVTYDPAGSLLAVGSEDGSVRVWQPSDGTLVHHLVGHTARVYTVAFHPHVPLLASADMDGTVRIWDVATGLCRSVLTGHESGIYWVTFSPTGDLLASGDRSGAVRLWDVATGQLRHALARLTGSVWPFRFRADGAQLAISDDQFTARLWDTATGQVQHVLTGHGRQVTSVSFSADGDALATSGNDGVVRLWDPRTGRLQRTLTGTEERLVTLNAAVFGPAGRLLVTASNDGRVNLLDVEADRHERHLTMESPPVWALAISPDGEMLATANDDDAVRLWYRPTGALVHTLSAHEGRVRSIAFHPSRPVVATGCNDHRVRLWSTETGELLRELRGHDDRVAAVSFSADGSLLASAAWDGAVRVWSAEGEPLHVLLAHTGRLWAAAFGPSGHLLASAGDDLVIRLWDAQRGVVAHTLVGHARRVWSVSFSPDGTLLASAGDDGTARLWSIGEGPEPGLKLTLLGLREGWAAVALDGRYKMSGDVGGQFWHAVGMCRFDPGELDPHLPSVHQLPPDTPF